MVLIDGPHFKGTDKYLDEDGDNPQAPWPGYGWPLGSECWYFLLKEEPPSFRYAATGVTVQDAWLRALELSRNGTTLLSPLVRQRTIQAARVAGSRRP